MRRALPWAFLALGVLSVSGGSLFARLAPDASPIAQAFWRCAIGAVLCWLAFRPRMKLGRDALPLVVAGFLLAAHFGLWLSSLRSTSVSVSVVLVSTTPCWVALLGRWTGAERLSRWGWFGIFTSLVGAIVMVSGRFAVNSLLGPGLALGGAFAMAGVLTIGKGTRSRVSGPEFTVGVVSVAAAALLGLCLASNVVLVGYSPSTWFALMGLGVVSQGIGHTSLYLALSRFRAAAVAVAALAEPALASVFAWWLLGEAVSPGVWIGGPIILAGVGLVLAEEARSQKKSAGGLAPAR